MELRSIQGQAANLAFHHSCWQQWMAIPVSFTSVSFCTKFGGLWLLNQGLMLDFAMHLFVGMSVGCGISSQQLECALDCGFLVLKQNNGCLLFLAQRIFVSVTGGFCHLFCILMINSLSLASMNGCRRITMWTHNNLGCKNKVISVHAMKACGGWRYGSTHSATTLDGDEWSTLHLEHFTPGENAPNLH